jgi:3-oxoacyl-[acyl-carrier protein] reductase
MNFQGQVALVTGASRGIGRAIALRLADEGAHVAVNYRTRADAALDVVARIEDAGGKAVAIGGDVADPEQAHTVVRRTLEELGGLHVLVNNAGIAKDARLQKMTLAQFDAVIDVNLRGVFQATQAVLPAMLAQGSGVILNASSVVGIYGNFGQTNYAASKFGVIGFTKTWSRELGPKGIRVNAVSPGFIETSILATIPDKVLQHMREQVPLHRLGKPEEIANVYAFLASDEASYINGAVIEVSGGMTV